MGITKDPFVLGKMQGHLLQSIRSPHLVKPTWKCEVKVPMTQERMMTSQVRSMLSKSTTEVGPGNKGFLHNPFYSHEKWGKPLYHKPEAASLIHNLPKVQDGHPETN